MKWKAQPREGAGSAAGSGLLSPHRPLLCPPEYNIEAAQEKDRQALKLTEILQTQKTNCDGYAGLFEKMCRYKRQAVGD